MFVMGILVQRWTTINFPMVVSKVPLAKGAYIEISKRLCRWYSVTKNSWRYSRRIISSPEKVTTLQDNLNQLVPGLAALLLTFLCMWLLKRKVSPIVIIFGLFAVGILGHLVEHSKISNDY